MSNTRFPLSSASRESGIPISRSRIVLAAMAGAEEGARFNAVQLENLLLLIDREVAEDIDGPHFSFEPFPYGPYDAEVLGTVDGLASEGKVVVDGGSPYWVCLQDLSMFGARHGCTATPSRYMSVSYRIMPAVLQECGPIPVKTAPR